MTDNSSDAETAVPEPTVSSIANDDASNLAVIPTTDSAAEDGQTTQQAVIIAPRSDIVIVNGSNYKKSVGASALASMRNSASPEARIGHRASKSGPVPTDRSLATQAASIMAPGPSRLPIRHQQPHQSEKHAQRAEKSQAQSPQKSVMATPPMGPSNINMHRGADLIQQRCSNAHKRQSDTEVYLACDCNRCMTASRSIHVRRISSGSSNLSKEQIETILTNYFSTWGHVEAVVAKTKVIDNRRSCYANVRFTSEKSALIAVANANDRPLEPLSKCASVSHPYFSKWFIPAPMRSPFRKFRERNDSTTTRTTWQSSPKTSSPGSSGPRNSWNTPPRGSRGMMPVATPSSARSITVPHQFQGNVPPVHFFAPSGHYSRPVDVPYGPFYHQLPPNLHQMTHGAPPAQAWADMRLQPGFVHSQTPLQPNPSLMGPPRSLPSNQDVMPIVRHIFRQNELTVTEEAVSTVSDSACNERSSYGQTKNGEANDMQTRPSIEDDLANDLYGPKPTKSSSSKPGSAISVRLPSMSPTRASSPANMEPETTSSNENKDIQDGKDDGKAKKCPDLSIYCEGEPVQASIKEESPASPEEDNSDQAIQRDDEAKELPSASATAGQDRSSDGHLNGNNSPKNPSALSRSGSRNSVRYSSRFDVGDIRLEEGFSETVIHRPNRRQNIFAEWMPTGEDGYEHLSDGPNNTNSRPSRNDRRIYQHGNYHRKRKIPFSAAQYRNVAGDSLAATHVSTPPVLAPVPLVNPLNKNKHHLKKSSVSNAGATTNGGAQASTSTIVVTSEFQEQGARRLDQQPCNEQKSSNNAITANNPRTNVNGPTKSKRNKRKAATAAAAAVALTDSVSMNGANGSSTSTNTTADKANGNTPPTTSTSVTTPAAHGTTAKPTNGTAENPSSESSRAATPAISDSSVTISASPREVPAPTRARSGAGVRASSTVANDTTVPSSVPTVSAQSTTTACTPTSTSSALAPAPPVRVPSYSEVLASGVTKSKNGNNAAVFKGKGKAVKKKSEADSAQAKQLQTE